MSHTTSARFVNLTVSKSLNAQALHYLILFGLAWAVIFSDIPLVLSSYLLLLIYRCHTQGGFVMPSTVGDWYCHRDGTVRNDAQTSLLSGVDLSASVFKVTFKLVSGDKVTVWRDSCDDVSYRQLNMILRQWKMGAEAPI
nr:hypothetical protein [Vibrio sp. MOR3]